MGWTSDGRRHQDARHREVDGQGARTCRRRPATAPTEATAPDRGRGDLEHRLGPPDRQPAEHEQDRDGPVDLGDRQRAARGPDQAAEGGREGGGGDVAGEVGTAHQVDADSGGDRQHDGGHHVARQGGERRRAPRAPAAATRTPAAPSAPAGARRRRSRRTDDDQQGGDHGGERHVVQRKGDERADDRGGREGDEPRRTSERGPQADHGAAGRGQDDERRCGQPRRRPTVEDARDVDAERLGERRRRRSSVARSALPARSRRTATGRTAAPASGSTATGRSAPARGSATAVHARTQDSRHTVASVEGVVERGEDDDVGAEQRGDGVPDQGWRCGPGRRRGRPRRRARRRPASGQIAPWPQRCASVWSPTAPAEPGDHEVEPAQRGGGDRRDPQRRARQRRPDPAEARAARRSRRSIGTGASTGTCAPSAGHQHGERRDQGGRDQRAGQGQRRAARARPSRPPPRRVVTRPASLRSPSQPACRAPTTSRATSPRPDDGQRLAGHPQAATR